MEEVLVDQARLVAGLVSAEMADGRSYPQRLQKGFDEAYRNDRYLRGRRCVRQH